MTATCVPTFYAWTGPASKSMGYNLSQFYGQVPIISVVSYPKPISEHDSSKKYAYSEFVWYLISFLCGMRHYFQKFSFSKISLSVFLRFKLIPKVCLSVRIGSETTINFDFDFLKVFYFSGMVCEVEVYHNNNGSG